MMNRQKFIKLFSKKLSGEIDADDRALLDTTISENEYYRDLSAHLDNYLTKQNTSYNSNGQQQLNQIWATIDANENDHFNGKHHYWPKFSRYSGFWLKGAAALIAISLIGLLLYKLINPQPLTDIEQLTTTNAKTFKVLNDGTKVWLNKHSTLSYNKAFGREAREITIEGEAFFDVVKNNRIPLFVHAGNIDIEVKGTAFNVRTEKNNHGIEVALVRGLIKVSNRKDKNSSLLLYPNQKVVYNGDKKDGQNKFGLEIVNESALLKETGWIADTLIFSKEKLKNLAVKMEKKYDVKINIQSEALKEKRFSGLFINETIEQALTSLKLSYPLTYTINKRLVVIKEQE
ncbi:FecR family protein [Pedobacter endophyticus]|uniref:FecR family protein n=1 Tax=Pedobacter endophyticus TaxID=2789740 RepID=A0A7S9Q0N7_9SPHI|nr:FecR family protein [Pedobacter endophyticus]QPH40897.1 FecR family protein [Pedobacter endophyticus]